MPLVVDLGTTPGRSVACEEHGGLSRVLLDAQQALDQGQRENAMLLLDRQAERYLERFLRRFPDRVDAMHAMGMLLLKLNQLQRSRRWFERERACQPAAAAYAPLAHIAHQQQRFGDAADLRARAVDCQPDQPAHWLELAKSLVRTGRLPDGLGWLYRLVDADPGHTEAVCKLLFYLHYLPGFDRAQSMDIRDRWRAYVPAVTVDSKFADHDRTVSRRLRIAYLSGDLRANSISYTFEGILCAHRSDAVEVTVYSHLDQPDGVTQRIARSVDHFRDVSGLDAVAVAQMIRADRIDILISLSTDLDPLRLAVCDRRPAPIQADWGSVGTVLSDAIDYRLSDALRDPPKIQGHYRELLACTQHLAFCYRPPEHAPAVTALPAQKQGRVTFGSFNTLLKLNPEVIHLWSRVLLARPRSRLVLKFAGGSCAQTRTSLLNAFVRHGVAPERVDIRGWISPVNHLNAYSEIDIALDPFPFNGMVTTLESLWMGVPVVTLGGGDGFVSRCGEAILSELKLSGLVAANTEDYLAKTAGLAHNLNALVRMRRGLRSLLQQSSLCDASLHAREFEALYRHLWQRWCASCSGSVPDDTAAQNAPGEDPEDCLDIAFPGTSIQKLAIRKAGVPPALFQAMEAVEQGQIEQVRQLMDATLVEQVESLIRDEPRRADVLFLMGLILRRSKQPERARPWLHRALAELKHPFISFELAVSYFDSGRMSQAIAVLQQALATHTDSVELKSTLADYLMKAGRPEAGLRLLTQVIEEQPDRNIYSKFLWHCHQQDALDEAQLFQWHRQWARRYAPAALGMSHPRPSRERQGPLRVGYISGDFCSHSVAYFVEPLLDAHDPQCVETWGYSNVPHRDLVTERLQAKFNHYRNICGVPDEQVVRWILADRIDILVDLSGHTGDNRLGVLAWKPAPIQVSFLGYPDTTGMEQVDYRLTDRWADRPEAQAFYTEQLILLETGFNCYAPPGFAPPVEDLPALAQGYLTFGSFNNSYKINNRTVELWCAVLRALPDARLLLKFGGGDDETVQQTFRQRFEQRGVDGQRIRLVGRLPVAEHLSLYNQVDLALDTFPYHGTTTTCEALWMGVPVLSLLGQHHICRVALSLLTRVGLDLFACHSEDEWVGKAVAFAEQPEQLAEIRRGLRGAMAGSPLCDKQAYARSVEAAYEQMWQTWTESG